MPRFFLDDLVVSLFLGQEVSQAKCREQYSHGNGQRLLRDPLPRHRTKYDGDRIQQGESHDSPPKDGTVSMARRQGHADQLTLVTKLRDSHERVGGR